MPLGCASLVPRIVQDLEENSRIYSGQRFLDLGIGYGFWGAVIRQYVDRGFERPTYIMGVEGFAAYRSKCWSLYDWVHVMPIGDYLAGDHHDQFDVILLLDVIEHFDFEAGHEIIYRAKSRLSEIGRFYVGTPAKWQEQGAANGNEFERHRSLWDSGMLGYHGFDILEEGVEANAYGHNMLLGVYSR